MIYPQVPHARLGGGPAKDRKVKELLEFQAFEVTAVNSSRIREGQTSSYRPGKRAPCRIAVVISAVTPIAGRVRSGWSAGTSDQDDPDTVGVFDPHLDQSPGLGRGSPGGLYASRGHNGRTATLPNARPS